jgi:hypothetical protein
MLRDGGPIVYADAKRKPDALASAGFEFVELSFSTANSAGGTVIALDRDRSASAVISPNTAIVSIGARAKQPRARCLRTALVERFPQGERFAQFASINTLALLPLSRTDDSVNQIDQFPN